jgi:hypothetical protein
MNLRDRLKIRGLVNLIVSVLERLVSLIIKLSPKPKVDNSPVNKPNRPRPLKKVVDTIDNIVPLPWRK